MLSFFVQEVGLEPTQPVRAKGFKSFVSTIPPFLQPKPPVGAVCGCKDNAFTRHSANLNIF